MRNAQATLMKEASICLGASDRPEIARYDEYRRQLLDEALEHLRAVRLLGVLSPELASESMRIGSAVQERFRAMTPLTLQPTGS